MVSYFLKGVGGAQEILSEPASPRRILGGKGRYPGVEAEATVAPGLQLGNVPLGDGPGGL